MCVGAEMARFMLSIFVYEKQSVKSEKGPEIRQAFDPCPAVFAIFYSLSISTVAAG
jgi:hypothetical protein